MQILHHHYSELRLFIVQIFCGVLAPDTLAEMVTGDQTSVHRIAR
jgi:hypothetical protein